VNAGLPPPRWRRFAPAAAFTVAALALLLPGLGQYGLWEPWELRLTDQAAALAGIRPPAGASIGPASQALLPALGIRLFGFSEAASRLPGVLVALATLAAVAWAAAGLYGRRAAAIAATATMAMPLFVLQARQLTSDMPLLLASALALGGLGRLGREQPGRRALGGALWVLFGLGLGAATGGVLVGVVAPCLAFAAAWRLSGLTFSSRLQRGLAVGVVAGGLGLALVAALTPYRAGQASWLLGGTPVLGAAARTFDAVLRVLGFGLFPWGALALLALLAPLVALTDETPAAEERGQSFAALLPLFAGAFGLAAATVQLHLVGQARISILPAVALALSRLLSEPRSASANRLLAFFAATGTLLVTRDLWLSPEELVSVHLSSKVTWPPGLSLRPLVAAVGVAFTAALLARFAVGPAVEAAGRAGRLLALARRLSVPVLLASGFALSAGLAHGVVPALSRHLSQKALLDSFRSLGGRALALYRIPAANRGSFDIVQGVHLLEVENIQQLSEKFRADPTLFALIPRADLPALDDAFAEAAVDYAVADASSSRFLLLAARLPAGHADHNPLDRHRFRARATAVPPWNPTRLQTSATYGDVVELYGADFPASVRRPGSFPLVLYFRTLRRPPAGYKIFVHVERPGALVHGDHPPLEGVFPIERWRPGDLLRDQHRVPVSLVTTPAGLYTIFVGFWPGGDTVRRLPVTGGEHDGNDRVALGNIRIN
jgi:4-amino-4-deoxy-L-arabinose transferase-like glycosyltransferase